MLRDEGSCYSLGGDCRGCVTGKGKDQVNRKENSGELLTRGVCVLGAVDEGGSGGGPREVRGGQSS